MMLPKVTFKTTTYTSFRFFRPILEPVPRLAGWYPAVTPSRKYTSFRGSDSIPGGLDHYIANFRGKKSQTPSLTKASSHGCPVCGKKMLTPTDNQDVFVCLKCQSLYRGLDDIQDSVAPTGDIVSPKDIVSYLDQHIVGQKYAKMTMAVAVYNHFCRMRCLKESGAEAIEKSNILLVGPSGSGKTLMAKVIARLLNVPFASFDATVLTQAGYVGDDVESILLRLLQSAQYDVQKAERGIVFLDEVDKIAKRQISGSGNSRDIGGEGVQQALLKILEGTTVSVPLKSMTKQGEARQVNTTNILFILSGAFSGIEGIVQERLESKSIGFLRNEEQASQAEFNAAEVYKQIEPTDLISFGLIPEFVGRVPVISPLKQLTVDELTSTLDGPQNSILAQYRRLFRLNNIELDVTKGGLREIAQLAVDRKTGARGLRNILEKILLPAMYRGPASGISGVRIDAEVVQQKKPIHYSYSDSKYGTGPVGPNV